MILLTLFVISEAVFATDLKGFCDTRSTSKNTLKLPILKPQTNIESEGTNCHIANLETIDIIRCHGYPAKAYEVTTEDGYILTLHRIEHGKANAGDDFWRPIVFLQHDFLGSSADFVIQHHSKSLGFILADNGYDVWMGNFRGNTYSRKHESLSPNKRAYWNFAIDELARYDMPAMIDFILEETTEGDLMFVGHGMGTTAFMAMSHYRPDISNKVRLANFMAPMAYFSNMKSPIADLAREEGILEFFFTWFGDGELLPSSTIIDCLASLYCQNPATQGLCSELIFLLAGFDSDQLNTTLIDSFMHHSPAGTSSRTLLHILQMVKSGEFHGYDWGSHHANQEHHGENGIPNYMLYNVESPVAVYYGDNDWLAADEDVQRAISELPFIVWDPKIMIHEVNYENWNHVDFVWGMDAKDYVYQDLVNNSKLCESLEC